MLIMISWLISLLRVENRMCDFFETMQDALRRFHWQQAYKRRVTAAIWGQTLQSLLSNRSRRVYRNIAYSMVPGGHFAPLAPLMTITAGDWSQLTSLKFILTAMRSQCSRITYRHMLLNEFKNFLPSTERSLNYWNMKALKVS